MLHTVAICTCDPTELCDRCFGRELVAHRSQARVLGAMWAEQVARLPEYRGRECWPMTGKVQEIARRKVQALTKDARLHEELAQDCIAGAAAWWERHAAQHQAGPRRDQKR
jgi:hypothetical protein